MSLDKPSIYNRFLPYVERSGSWDSILYNLGIDLPSFPTSTRKTCWPGPALLIGVVITGGENGDVYIDLRH